jgi:disulfide bond formation protein DsbB
LFYAPFAIAVWLVSHLWISRNLDLTWPHGILTTVAFVTGTIAVIVGFLALMRTTRFVLGIISTWLIFVGGILPLGVAGTGTQLQFNSALVVGWSMALAGLGFVWWCMTTPERTARQAQTAGFPYNSSSEGEK